ncbi:MAG TPA: hypothetical protein VNM15_03240, partial [Candidatus Binatia bacterium]|nr:hypothetical protein [Candidatus Binatia bacterium]
AALKELAARFFAQDVAVQVAEAAGQRATTGTEPRSPTSMEAADDHSPMVKEALRIFGGSIRAVRRDDG